MLVTALAGISAGSAARAADLPPLHSDRAPYFTADIAITLDADGHPGLSVSVTIPYPELAWVRVDRGYGAGALISVSFEPRGKGRVFGDTWERRLVVPTFGLTISPNATIVEKRAFPVDPEKYRVRVRVQDLNSEGESSASDRIDVPDYTKVPVGFADLDLGVTDTSGAFVSSPTRRFGLEVSRLVARVALFDRRSGSWPRTYTFRYKILDETGDEITGGSQQVTIHRSAEPVLVRPGNSELFLGNYQFEVELNEGRSKWRVDRTFEVEESGPPRGKEFDRMLEALSYIADAHEIQYLRSLPPDQQARGWEEFWKKRDPTPDTPRNEAMIEFFRRLRYANQHFQGLGPGWRSDMGRIYIRYGPPDQVETRPATSDSPQLEVWYYNNPYRRFVFADRDGFGRYVLTGPVSE